MFEHVYPVDDLVEHNTNGDDCVCGPTWVLLNDGEGDVWLLRHHSLDGREMRE